MTDSTYRRPRPIRGFGRSGLVLATAAALAIPSSPAMAVADAGARTALTAVQAEVALPLEVSVSRKATVETGRRDRPWRVRVDWPSRINGGDSFWVAAFAVNMRGERYRKEHRLVLEYRPDPWSKWWKYDAGTANGRRSAILRAPAGHAGQYRVFMPSTRLSRTIKYV